jgi:hypothetical protein
MLDDGARRAPRAPGFNLLGSSPVPSTVGPPNRRHNCGSLSKEWAINGPRDARYGVCAQC